MISTDYFDSDKSIKEYKAKINLIRNSTLSYLFDYFKNIINDVDIYAEINLSKKDPSQIQDIKDINNNRKLIFDKISELELLYKKNIKILKDDKTNFSSKDFESNQLLSTINELKHLKSLLFKNKWIFFRGNKRIKSDQIDFGRLIIIDGIFTEDLVHNFNCATMPVNQHQNLLLIYAYINAIIPKHSRIFMNKSLCKIGDFDNPANLKRFILSKNSNQLCNDFVKLYSISRQISIGLKDIDKPIIEISHEQIMNIDEITFERYELNSIDQLVYENEFSQLKTIDLNHNKITIIQPKSFLNLINLKNLILSFNKIEKIESNWFENLVNLEQLDLSNNRINSIDNDAFIGLKNLKLLDLSGNRLAELNSQAFDRLISLIEIDLSCNNFKRVYNFMFTGLVNLENLYLNSNEIESVEDNALHKLNNLKEIHLNMNKIESINDQVFNHQLNSLVKIDFRFNEIKTINPKVFETLNALKLVLVYGNIDLIHRIDPRDFYRIDDKNEKIEYLTFNGNYYDSEEEMDEDEEEETDDEMDYNSEASDSEQDDENDNYDSDY